MKVINGVWKTSITSPNSSIISYHDGIIHISYEATNTIVSEHFIPAFNNLREARRAQLGEWILITQPQEYKCAYQCGDCFKILGREDTDWFRGCRVAIEEKRQTEYGLIPIYIPDTEYEVITNYKEI